MVVKNTFLDVPLDDESHGIAPGSIGEYPSTAPASLVGTIKQTLAETELTAGVDRDSPSEMMWPATPSSPRERVQISLDELTGGDCGMFQDVSYWQIQSYVAWDEFVWQNQYCIGLPPPPLGSPKLPPTMDFRELEPEPAPPQLEPAGVKCEGSVCLLPALAPIPSHEPPSAPPSAPALVPLTSAEEGECSPPAFDVTADKSVIDGDGKV